VCHDADVAAGRQLASEQRTGDEVDVGAAGERIAPERHLEPSALELEAPGEPHVDERVPFGLQRIAEFVGELVLEALVTAFDLDAPAAPIRVNAFHERRIKAPGGFEPGPEHDHQVPDPQRRMIAAEAEPRRRHFLGFLRSRGGHLGVLRASRGNQGANGPAQNRERGGPAD
jgi:hypothetical protein